MLARFLVDERRVARWDDVPVLYFFFKDGQQGQTKCEDAIGAILHQLYTEDTYRSMVVHALPRFKAHGQRMRNMFDELWGILEKTMNQNVTGEIVCVIDAVDE